MTEETTYPIYYAYWNDYNYADTFITKDYSATVKGVGWAQLMKKGANYQAVWMYVLHNLRGRHDAHILHHPEPVHDRRPHVLVQEDRARRDAPQGVPQVLR